MFVNFPRFSLSKRSSNRMTHTIFYPFYENWKWNVQRWKSAVRLWWDHTRSKWEMSLKNLLGSVTWINRELNGGALFFSLLFLNGPLFIYRNVWLISVVTVTAIPKLWTLLSRQVGCKWYLQRIPAWIFKLSWTKKMRVFWIITYNS